MDSEDSEASFRRYLDIPRAEGCYPLFGSLERRRSAFPHAYDHRTGDEVTIWCPNDYLGMGRHPIVLDAMVEAIDILRAGSGSNVAFAIRAREMATMDASHRRNRRRHAGGRA